MTDKSPEELARKWAHRQIVAGYTEGPPTVGDICAVVHKNSGQPHSVDCDRHVKAYLAGHASRDEEVADLELSLRVWQEKHHDS